VPWEKTTKGIKEKTTAGARMEPSQKRDRALVVTPKMAKKRRRV